MADSWSNLFDDILDKVIHKLDIITFIQFSAVCKSWRNSSETHLRDCTDKSTKTIPWLIFKESPKFYSFFDRKTYNYPLDFPPFHKCFGSSNGFLLITDPKDSNLFVVNPSTGVFFSFPILNYRWFHKAVMVVSPYNASSDPKQRVMVAILTPIILFLKFDGTSTMEETPWTHLGVLETESPVVDIIFHKERLYATKLSAEIFFFDLNSVPIGERQMISGIPFITVLTDERYFVESPNGDELFMVVKRIDNATNCFVFKYDEGRDEWMEVKSLGDIAFFVGCSSLSIFPELYCESSVVAKDCIYYFDRTDKGDHHLEVLSELNTEEKFYYGLGSFQGKEQRRMISGDVFEFSMADGSIKRLDASVQMSWWASPMWFLPSMKYDSKLESN